jgi:type II secretory pathway component PulF
MHLKILAILTAISILVYGIGVHFLIPEFERLFIEFKTELPFVTKLVFATYRYWLILLVIPIGIYVKYLNKEELTTKIENRILFLFVAMLLFSIVLLPLLVTVMYLPIFGLEASNV